MLVLLFVGFFALPTSAALILGSPPCCGATSCRNRCDDTGWDKKESIKSHCHCDPFCTVHQDCCPDYYEYCAARNLTLLQQKQEPFHSRAKCVKTNTQKGYPGTLMITTCASDWVDTEHSDEQEKCLAATQPNSSYTAANITEYIPVFELGFGRATYRNVHCGLCNRAVRFFLKDWFLEIECALRPPDGLDYEQTLDFLMKHCASRKLQPEGTYHFRYCYPALTPVSNCSNNTETIYRRSCLQDPVAIVHDKGTNTNYKNYGCFRCNGLSGFPGCGPAPGDNIFKPKSFAVVMDLEKKTAKTNTVCFGAQVYDPWLEICRFGKIPGLSAAVRDKFQVNAWLTPEKRNAEALTAGRFRDALCERFSLEKSQLSGITRTLEGPHAAFLFDLDAVPTQKRYNASGADIRDLLQFNSSFQLHSGNDTWTVFRVTSRQLSCSKGQLYQPGEFNLSFVTADVFIYNTSERFPETKYQLIRTNASAPIEEASVFVCRSSFASSCASLLLPVDEGYYTITANGSLVLNRTGQVISTENYELDGAQAWICPTLIQDSHRRNSTTETKESAVLTYTTIAGMSVSVVCLFLVLVVHCILPELRNPLPGKNLMNLCLSLFLAHFLWLLGSGDTEEVAFCAATAMALHYLFLVSFACTVILAFDTWRTFSSKMSAAKGSGASTACGMRFSLYSGFAWGVPLLWVAGCATLDHTGVVDVGYGGANVCWITNIEAIIVAFATPAACALIYNLAAFSQTAWAIHRAKQRAAKLQTSRKNNSALKIYARLVTLMGFSWFFAFSAVLIHESLMYPFVLFNTTQGLYIFLAFICKERVWKLLKQKFRPSKKGEGKTTQQTTTSRASYRHEDDTVM